MLLENVVRLSRAACQKSQIVRLDDRPAIEYMRRARAERQGRDLAGVVEPVLASLSQFHGG